jgi:uncharacterized protein (TIGR00730 family)
MKAIGVFCGSSPGTGATYVDAARDAGRFFAGRGIEIVYGGGRVGLMGAIADAALAAGGRVTGVIPRWLVEREIAHTGLTDLHVVENLHERKEKMAELASGFVALPGAAGTLRRPSIVELFSPQFRQTTLVTTVMFACSYGAAFGAIQHMPRIVPGLDDVRGLPRPAQPQIAMNGATAGANIRLAQATTQSAASAEASKCSPTSWVQTWAVSSP